MLGLLQKGDLRRNWLESTCRPAVQNAGICGLLIAWASGFNVGALTIRIGVWGAHYTIIIIWNPQISIGNYSVPYIIGFWGLSMDPKP